MEMAQESNFTWYQTCCPLLKLPVSEEGRKKGSWHGKHNQQRIFVDMVTRSGARTHDGKMERRTDNGDNELLVLHLFVHFRSSL
jgi:hypothetical protein